MTHDASDQQPRLFIGRYEVIAEIGRGSMGVVYQAYEPLLERVVALKVLSPELMYQPGLIEQLRHEAISTARLRHLNIALLYEFAQIEQSAFLVMEYIPGTSLRAMLGSREGKRFSWQRTLLILEQIGQALDYMHRLGIVHRDVKPGNIMLGSGDHAVLIDFGLAVTTDRSVSTADQAMIGTPTYMSPEQVAGTMVNARSDQYALACVAYQMLTGVPPFHQRAPVAIAHAHLYESPVPPTERDLTLPEAVDRVLLRALAKNPQHRYPTLDAFVHDLRMALDRPLLSRRRLLPQGLRPQVGMLILICLVFALILQTTMAQTTSTSTPTLVSAQREQPLSQQIAWTYEAEFVGGAPLVWTNGVLIVPNLDGGLTALDAENGQLKWQEDKAVFGSPSADRDLVFAGTPDQEVLALSAQSGGVVWRTRVEGIVHGAPAIYGDQMIIITSKGYVYALQSANGHIIWSRPLMYGLQTSTITAGRVLITTDRMLLSLDLENGGLKWEFTTIDLVTTSPAILNDMVIIGTDHGTLYGISLSNGHEQWQYQSRGRLNAAPAIDLPNERFFVVDQAGSVVALNALTGQERWRVDTNSAITTTPLLVDTRLFFGTSNGVCYVLNASTGQQLAQIPLLGTIDTSPILGGNLIYVRANRIYALSI